MMQMLCGETQRRGRINDMSTKRLPPEQISCLICGGTFPDPPNGRRRSRRSDATICGSSECAYAARMRRPEARNRQRAMHRAYKKTMKGRAIAKAWRGSEAGRTLARRVALKHDFGLTPEQYETMLARQGGVCAICGFPPKTRRLAVDHDHGESKRVRGLLCFRCNKYRVGTNTVATARLVLAYLESGFDGRTL